MTITIDKVEGSERNWLISPEIVGTISDKDYGIMRDALRRATMVWVATKGDTVLGFWGVMLPSLISDSVYLWLYTTPNFAENCFVCVRHSQMIVRELLADYPKIYGHCVQGEDKSIRWLKWLGAEFQHPLDDRLIPFEIKAA